LASVFANLVEEEGDVLIGPRAVGEQSAEDAGGRLGIEWTEPIEVLADGGLVEDGGIEAHAQQIDDRLVGGRATGCVSVGERAGRRIVDERGLLALGDQVREPVDGRRRRLRRCRGRVRRLWPWPAMRLHDEGPDALDEAAIEPDLDFEERFGVEADLDAFSTDGGLVALAE
jgi:hypothetical protein